jgi:hypothetical protein
MDERGADGAGLACCLGFCTGGATPADGRACQPCPSRHYWRLMPPARTVAKYTLDALLIFVPLAVVIYFLFDPDAFNAFLAWLVRRH